MRAREHDERLAGEAGEGGPQGIHKMEDGLAMHEVPDLFVV